MSPDAVTTVRDAISRDATPPTVSVIIPALNEARNLPHVARAMPVDIDEIVVVDGGSKDDTVAVARELWPDAVHIKQTRRGKGNALACGFAAASGDIIVAIDADGSTDPAEIPRFVAALTEGADFAKGSRFIAGGGSLDITRLRRAGNWGLNALVNVLFAATYTDLCYGYNAFWRYCLDVIDLPDTETLDPQWGDGFEIETMVNVRAVARGLTIAEVHSLEANRIHGESNLNAVRDGLRVLRTIISEFHSHARVKAPRGSHDEGNVVPFGTFLSRRLRRSDDRIRVTSKSFWKERAL
ncbi:glycosyltransferase family 2 protein [Mycolicibacterium murale]|nr:glycosyltransferase family 2 protein [Mycolicibacterium murale]MCV7181949.1 glycosyltransferase family 2 protein [Mycolicibacterium murale]